MRITYFVILALALMVLHIGIPLNAQTGTAGQAGEFLRYGVGAKALAMGRAFTSVADDASAIYWNPAGIGQFDQINLGFMQSQLFLDTRYQFFGIASPLYFLSTPGLRHNLGFGFINLHTDDFEGRDAFNNKTENFSTQEFAFMIPYALSLINSWGNFNFGVKPIFFNQEIQGVSGGGVGVDVGLVYQPMSPRKYTLLGLVPLKFLMPWRFGINYRMLSSVTLINQKQEYPNSLNIGVSNSAIEDLIDLALPWDLLANLPMKLLVSYEFEKIFGVERDPAHHLGAELRWRFGQAFVGAFRLGKQFGGTDFGGGVNWGFGFSTDADLLQEAPLIQGLEVDFSRTSHRDLDNTFQMYFTLKLGKQKYDAGRLRRQTAQTEDELLSQLVEYPTDIRVTKEREGIDAAYKDTVATGLYLLADSQADTFLSKRYCDFMGGFCGVRFPGFTCNMELNRERLNAFLANFEGRQGDLEKDFNFKYLKMYLDALLLLGENERVKSIVLGTNGIDNKVLKNNSDEQNYYLAYATKEPQYGDRLLNKANKFEKIYLALIKAVYLEQSQPVQNILSDYHDEVFGRQVDQYPIFPLICDGILADDVMFITAYEQARKEQDAKQIRDLFLPIVLALPQTDLARAIEMRLPELGDHQDNAIATFGVFEKIWKQYRELFLKNHVINEKYLITDTEEQVTIKN